MKELIKPKSSKELYYAWQNLEYKRTKRMALDFIKFVRKAIASHKEKFPFVGDVACVQVNQAEWDSLISNPIRRKSLRRVFKGLKIVPKCTVSPYNMVFIPLPENFDELRQKYARANDNEQLGVGRSDRKGNTRLSKNESGERGADSPARKKAKGVRDLHPRPSKKNRAVGKETSKKAGSSKAAKTARNKKK